MGLKLPGGITTPEGFWEFLVDKKDARCRVPSDRYNIDAFHNDKLRSHRIATDHGYFLQDINLKSFDTSFFPMTRRELETLDPQQRLLLEVVWECMESASQANWRGQKTGCYVGAFGEDWQDLLTRDTKDIPVARIATASDFSLSSRVSYEYNLQGPRCVVGDRGTACVC